MFVPSPRWRLMAAAGVFLAACARSPVHEVSVRADSVQAAPASAPAQRHIRSTGTVQAVRLAGVQVPQIRGPGGQLTLIRLIPNGSKVQEGDLIAEFDSTQKGADAPEPKATFHTLPPPPDPPDPDT